LGFSTVVGVDATGVPPLERAATVVESLSVDPSALTEEV